MPHPTLAPTPRPTRKFPKSKKPKRRMLRSSALLTGIVCGGVFLVFGAIMNGYYGFRSVPDAKSARSIDNASGFNQRKTKGAKEEAVEIEVPSFSPMAQDKKAHFGTEMVPVATNEDDSAGVKALSL